MRVAHLSDLHLNGTPKRRHKLAVAIDQAARAKAKHLILTGDLTASGKKEDFLDLKKILANSWSDGLTVIPGNHDGFGAFDEVFGKAPLVDLGELAIMPLDTRYQRRALAFWALGKVAETDLRALGRIRGFASKPMIIAMHHGPQNHPFQAFEGLTNRFRFGAVFSELPTAHVLCGHQHQVADYGKVHVAGSVAFHPDPLRLYDVIDGRIVPTYKSMVRIGAIQARLARFD